MLRILLLGILFYSCQPKSHMNDNLSTANPSKATTDTSGREKATLGNGCFWCTEAIFKDLKGVLSVTSGYSGGEMANPDYKTVCTGVTGHAECLEIEYDPKVISFEKLLDVFFDTHDPTTLNRQGNDVGTQYRSVIFYHNQQQRDIAEAKINELNRKKVFDDPVVTSLEIYSKFYPAENYHQDYYEKNGSAPYCSMVIRPKVQKFRKKYDDLLKN